MSRKLCVTVATTTVVPQCEDGVKFINELKERNKGHISKFKESTATILLETTYNVVVEMEDDGNESEEEE